LARLSACCERKATRAASRWPVTATMSVTSAAPSRIAAAALSATTFVVI
jgi:hypothetical protein